MQSIRTWRVSGTTFQPGAGSAFSRSEAARRAATMRAALPAAPWLFCSISTVPTGVTSCRDNNLPAILRANACRGYRSYTRELKKDHSPDKSNNHEHTHHLSHLSATRQPMQVLPLQSAGSQDLPAGHQGSRSVRDGLVQVTFRPVTACLRAT